MNEAQIYWDTNADGWSLRYRDAAGTEHSMGIEASRDASIQELAEAVRDESHCLSADGTITVCGEGDRPPRGSITIRGIEVEWVAL